MFRKICTDCGLDGKKTFHCLRTAAAERWRANGRSIREIASLLGHRGTGTVDFYLSQDSP